MAHLFIELKEGLANLFTASRNHFALFGFALGIHGRGRDAGILRREFYPIAARAPTGSEILPINKNSRQTGKLVWRLLALVMSVHIRQAG